MNVFDENKEVVFSTEEIKNEARATETAATKLDDEASDKMDISEAAIENEPEAAEDGLVIKTDKGQTFVASPDAYGYFDEEKDQGIIDQHEAYARQGRNQEYYRDPTYHKVRRNYEGRGRYYYNNGGNTYQRPRYNDVHARDNSIPDSSDQAASGYSEQTKYYTEDRRETGRDVVRQYNNDGIPVYTGRKSRQFETVGCVIRMLDLAGFKLGDRLVLIDKETGEVYR